VDNGYDLTIFPALATPEYKIYSGDKNQGGIGDNLASSLATSVLPIDPRILAISLSSDFFIMPLLSRVQVVDPNQKKPLLKFWRRIIFS